LSHVHSFPYLQRRGLRPAHIIFPAYKSADVADVLHQRLARLPGPAFDGNALELCARKVANGSGDMRRALEACALALDMLVQQVQQEKEKVAEQQKEADEAAAAVVAPRPARLVGVRFMATALGRLTGGVGTAGAGVSAIRSLPPQQQLLMCLLGKLAGETLADRGLAVRAPPAAGRSNSTHQASGRSAFIGLGAGNGVGASGLGGGGAPVAAAPPPRNREVLLGPLEQAHSTLCRQVGMQPYTSGEFATAVTILQDLGLAALIGPSKSEQARRRAVLRVPEEDLLMALADVPVLKGVIGA
jgi:hypothetical protein